ncbi:TetR/AcrR family transcriptional regulator [Chloroflexota bacterium]
MTKASERRVEKNKDRIIRAALELFRVHGIRKVAINDIAQKAGASAATVYNHFGSKEALVRAVVKHFFTSAAADFRKIMDGNLPFLEKLEQIFLYKSEIVGQYQGELLQTIVSDDPEIRQFIDSVYLVEMRQYLIDFYEEGKRRGYVNPELSAETIILYSEILGKGMAAESRLSEDPERTRKLMQELLPLCFYGLLGKPGK